jgi:hypothetical protein
MRLATTSRCIVASLITLVIAGTALAQTPITSSFYSAKAGERETELEYEADDDGGIPATVPCGTAMLSASGANQTWDFTTCVFSSGPLTTVTDYGTNVAGDVPMGNDPDFATGNFYARSYETTPASEASSWSVLRLTASSVTQLGFVVVEVAAPGYDTTLAVNNPVSMALSLPITYLDSWSDTTAFTIDGTTVAIAEDNLVDGWGTLITPAGSIGALRLQNERRSYAIFGGTTILTGVQYTYEFLTNGLLSAFIYHDNLGTADGAGYIVTSTMTLPVELATFDAVRSGSQAHLKWRTLSETNNSGFGIEHAVDQRPFREIGFVDGAGTIDSERNYSYSLDLLETGVHQFRLKQIDLDGSFTYSPIVELSYETPERFGLLQAYPNPFNPTTTITYKLTEAGEITLDVFDAIGQRVTRLASGGRSAGRHEIEFDATGLPGGLYLYRLIAGQQSETRTMVLLK